MKPKSLGACTALLSLATLGSAAQEPKAEGTTAEGTTEGTTQDSRASAQGGGLQRLEPEPVGPEALDPDALGHDGRGLEDLFARDFDRARWQARLIQPDLDQRERSFDALLRRARIDPLARAFLEELARSGAGPELAWTARLGLRELGRARFPLQGALQGAWPDPLGSNPFGSAQRLQQMMNELFAQGGLGFPHGAPGSQSRGGESSGRSVHIEQNERGALVRITETSAGGPRTRTYPGTSLEQILLENPALREELGGLHLRGELGSPWRPAGLIDKGLALAPQGKSRPLLTDRLGVIVQPIEASRARELGLVDQGLLVERAFSETYAHLLGVEAGDVLLELDGIPLRSGTDIERAMRARGPDDELTLVWLDELGQRQVKTWHARAAPEGKR